MLVPIGINWSTISLKAGYTSNRWPVKYLDLKNPFEDIWDVLGSIIARYPRSRTMQELKIALLQEWNDYFKISSTLSFSQYDITC